MTAWSELAQTKLPSGDVITLRQRGGDFEVRLNLCELMSSRNPASERTLARLACELIDPREACVLIGGLGLGYTARAVLDLVGPEASVVAVELVQEVIDWNRGPLADASGRPLDDRRLQVVHGDVADVLRARPRGFDVILMDVDNGPEAVLFPGNAHLYTSGGLQLILGSLRPGGVFALWAAEPSPIFEKVLVAVGRSERVSVSVQGTAGPIEHVIYLFKSKGADSAAAPGPRRLDGEENREAVPPVD
jgi:spermidine synthase